MWGANEWMGWWMLFAGVFWLLFIGIGVYLLAAAVQRSEDPPRRETALEVAQRRLAAGQISREEYERIREILSR